VLLDANLFYGDVLPLLQSTVPVFTDEPQLRVAFVLKEIGGYNGLSILALAVGKEQVMSSISVCVARNMHHDEVHVVGVKA
jgi:hypothetical protein